MRCQERRLRCQETQFSIPAAHFFPTFSGSKRLGGDYGTIAVGRRRFSMLSGIYVAFCPSKDPYSSVGSSRRRSSSFVRSHSVCFCLCFRVGCVTNMRLFNCLTLTLELLAAQRECPCTNTFEELARP